MNKTSIRRVVSALVLFGSGLATGLVAQTLNDSPQRKEQNAPT